MNRAAAHRRGLEAEARCAAWLEARGWRVWAQRVRTAGGEIDVVATLGDTLALVEVKARTVAADALFSVTPAEQARLARAGAALLAEPELAGLAPPLPLNIRFDVMAVAADGSILHLPDAWRPVCD